MAVTYRALRALSRNFRPTRRPLATLCRPQARIVIYATTITATATTTSTFHQRALADFAVTSSSTPPKTPHEDPEVVLYQYEVCPFCNKVRAYLDFHKIPYRIIEVDPLRKTQLKHLPADYRKVPIAVINGEQINDSSKIISHLSTFCSQKPPSDTEQKWLSWLDETFIHLIAPNIYGTPTQSLQTFDYITDNSKFSAWDKATIRYTGAAAMYFIGRKLKTKYDISDPRTEIHQAAAEWTQAIGEAGGKFLAGAEKPGVADLSVYGVLRAIQTFDTFREMREQNAELGVWFDRTREAVGDPCITARE